ncbi:MAG: DUF1294 domain-containing protein [Planctomycetes bacterium]|nr:DUF1294 domain-containing protein [Planctomycetota bacterium]
MVKAVLTNLLWLMPAVLGAGGLTIACVRHDRDWLAYGYLASLNVVAMAFYMWDKKMAAAGGQRIPENVLHLLALLGGTIGALAGQRCFRHKTRKLGFQTVFWSIVTFHGALAAVEVRRWYGGQGRWPPLVLTSAFGVLVIMNTIAALIYSQAGRRGRSRRDLACGIAVLGGGAFGAVFGDMRGGGTAKFAYLICAVYMAGILILAIRAVQALSAGGFGPV